jgi:hypothetical protein
MDCFGVLLAFIGLVISAQFSTSFAMRAAVSIAGNRGHVRCSDADDLGSQAGIAAGQSCFDRG